LARLLAMSVPVNAPVSFVTGFLFALASRWGAEDARLPVALVYMWETLGGALGGIFVTFLLWREISPEGVLHLAASLLLIASVTAVGIRRRAIPSFIILAGVIALSGAGMPALSRHVRALEWSRVLPREYYRGAFTTAQSQYLYGEREGQFIVASGGSICETLPPDDHAAEVAAIHLAQKPDARNVLVFGPDSLGVCAKLKSIPRIGRVEWMHPDPRYPARLASIVGGTKYARWLVSEPIGSDLRQYARQGSNQYDLVILNLPDATTLALNRYCTIEFFSLIKNLLAENGVVSLRISGPANYMGRELAAIGAAAYNTLTQSFKDVVIKSGDETWLFATNGNDLQMFPPSLRTRFSDIPGAAAIYPPENIPALFQPDRADKQFEIYRQTVARHGKDNLINIDRKPQALFYALLLTLKQAGYAALADKAAIGRNAAATILLAPFLLYLLFRLVYIFREYRMRHAPPLADAAFLIFSTGLAGMAGNLALIFIYQSRFGTLFLEMGLISALFMMGAFAGGATGRALAIRNLIRTRAAVLAVHVAFLLALVMLPQDAPRLAFIPLFFLCGLFTGIYFPFAAADYAAAGRAHIAAGASLEIADTLGGAAGGAITGLILLPLMGQDALFIGLAAIAAVNIPPAMLRRGSPRKYGDGFSRVIRPLGYWLAASAVYILIASNSLHAAVRAARDPSWAGAAREMAGTNDIVQKQAVIGDRDFLYYEAPATQDAAARYIFESSPWSDKIFAFAGSLRLAICVEADGKLRDYKILESRETQSYQSMVESKKSRLTGKNIFTANPFKDVEIVSGATITDEAIRRILETSGRGFAEGVLQQAVETQPVKKSNAHGLRDILVLSAIFAAALAVRYRPSIWARRILLAASLALAGLWLNLQFSTNQVISLLTLTSPPHLTGAFFLLFVIPALVALFGNVYCGYMCPFGAIQELAGDITGGRFAIRPGKRLWRWTRLIKYLILFAFVVAFAAARDSGVLRTDPLVTIFSGSATMPVVIFVIGVACVSAIFSRFWCRNLCPAGAFLTILGGLRPISRILPKRIPPRCDLGVDDILAFDCIDCDRCRIKSKKPVAKSGPVIDLIFAAAVAAALIAFVGMAMPSEKEVQPQPPAPAQSPVKAALTGIPRPADMEKIKALIEERKLSDHAADFQNDTTP
jgi:spermidine synthase